MREEHRGRSGQDEYGDGMLEHDGHVGVRARRRDVEHVLDWVLDRAFTIYGAQAIVGRFMSTFQAYPPRQEPASFTVGDAREALTRIASH